MHRRIGALQPHMRTAIEEVNRRLPQVDVVIEMRDARAPWSSENHLLSELTAHKPKRLLVLNKADLAHPVHRKVRV